MNADTVHGLSLQQPGFPSQDVPCVILVGFTPLVVWACGAEVRFLEKDASRKAKQKEVEEGHLTSV